MAKLTDLQEDKCRLCGEPRPKDIWHIWACCGDGPGYGDSIKPEKLACLERQLVQAKSALAESRGAQSRPEPILHLPDGSMIDASELAKPGIIVGVQGEDFYVGIDWTWFRPEVLLDEVDEDPDDRFCAVCPWRPDSSVGSSGSQDRAALSDEALRFALEATDITRAWKTICYYLESRGAYLVSLGAEPPSLGIGIGDDAPVDDLEETGATYGEAATLLAAKLPCPDCGGVHGIDHRSGSAHPCPDASDPSLNVQAAGGWVQRDAPDRLDGLYWLQFNDGSVGSRPAERSNWAWWYSSDSMHREHAPVIAYCPALPPPPPAPEKP